jgi:hypothetical protein
MALFVVPYGTTKQATTLAEWWFGSISVVYVRLDPRGSDPTTFERQLFERLRMKALLGGVSD